MLGSLRAKAISLKFGRFILEHELVLFRLKSNTQLDLSLLKINVKCQNKPKMTPICQKSEEIAKSAKPCTFNVSAVKFAPKNERNEEYTPIG